ncbi:MAG: protease inhibitor I42 family protein [Methanosarcina barkeri]|nr:protease inhibitor I42 family protein [Methanosarcina sp. ERenArc_MAG2]
MILNDTDNGHTVEVGLQSIVTVRLEEMPTTGYLWEIETAEGLKMISDSFEMSGDAIGAGVLEYSSFVHLIKDLISLALKTGAIGKEKVLK